MGAFIINIMIFEANVQQQKKKPWRMNLRRSLLSLLISLDTDCTEVLFRVFSKVYLDMPRFLSDHMHLHTLIKIQYM